MKQMLHQDCSFRVAQIYLTDVIGKAGYSIVQNRTSITLERLRQWEVARGSGIKPDPAMRKVIDEHSTTIRQANDVCICCMTSVTRTGR